MRNLDRFGWPVFIATAFVALSGCRITKGSNVEQFNTVVGTPSVEVSPTPSPSTAPVAPVVVDADYADVDPQNEITVVLDYDDANGDLATSCEISDLVWFTVSTPCSCTDGLCTVGVTHNTTYTGGLWGEFNYTVTAGGAASNIAHVRITTQCPKPALATGATLVADNTGCPAPVVSPTIRSGDILVLQEGGVNEGGYILAFDSNGCFKGRATEKGTPWYAVGLKVGAYANSISANNFVSILMATRVKSANNPGIYEWTGPFSSGAQTDVTLTSWGSGGNSARVPDDNADTIDDPHLVNVGADALLMRYSVTPIKWTTEGKKRVLADNVNRQLRGYINGVEKTECRLVLEAVSGGCPNCVAAANASQRVVTDIFVPTDSFFSSKVNYIWYESQTIDGLPRTVWGVSEMQLCSATTTGFSDLAHVDLFQSAPYSSSVSTNAVVKVRTIPNNTAASNDIYASMASMSDYIVGKWDFQQDGTYKQVCDGFQGSALSVYQDHYDTATFPPTYGDLFTFERDELGMHLRKYGVSGADAGKLKATLFTDSLTPASATAFKESTNFEGQWITVVPATPEP